MRRSRRAFLSSGTALLATALVSACVGSDAPQPEPTARSEPTSTVPVATVGATPKGGSVRVLIFHTNDVMGYVDPCG